MLSCILLCQYLNRRLSHAVIRPRHKPLPRRAAAQRPGRTRREPESSRPGDGGLQVTLMADAAQFNLLQAVRLVQTILGRNGMGLMATASVRWAGRAATCQNFKNPRASRCNSKGKLIIAAHTVYTYFLLLIYLMLKVNYFIQFISPGFP